MKKIKGVKLSNLQQGESFEFHSSVLKVLLEVGALQVDVTILAYKKAIEEFDEAFKQLRESAITSAITAADERRDHAWRGFRKANTAALNHFDPAIVQAAHTLDVLIRNYGDPTTLSYPNETSQIYNLCQDLENATYKPLVEKVGLSGWFKEMKTSNEAFAVLFEQRGEEQSTIVTGLAKEKRAATENAYRDMAERINAFIVLSPKPELETAVERVNYYVDYYNNIVATRKGRAAAEKKKKEEL
jgi:hypothetical protein